jgi:Tfp pilus assembly protein PilV
MIVATVLLAVGVTAASHAISSAIRMAATAQSRATAAMIAQDKFAEIEADPTQLTTGDQQGDFGNTHPMYSYRQIVEATTQSDLYKVTLIIQWQDGAFQKQAQFVTYEPTTLLSSTATSSTTTTGGTQ